MEKLSDLLIREGKYLQEEFDKASEIGKGTPQEIAEFRENALRDFIKRFYPIPYRIAKGKVFDSFDNEPSMSIDCIVVNPVHPNLIDTNGKFQLLLADGIDFAIELKPDLSSKSELERGLSQGLSLKKLRRARSPILLPNSPKYSADLIDYSKQIPFYIFTQKTKKTIEDTLRDIIKYYSSNSIEVMNQIDAIIINGIGILKNIKLTELFIYSWKLDEDKKTGWFFEEWADATLAGMLLGLEYSYHSTATVQESVMKRYLKSMTVPHIRRQC